MFIIILSVAPVEALELGVFTQTPKATGSLKPLTNWTVTTQET